MLPVVVERVEDRFMIPSRWSFVSVVRERGLFWLEIPRVEWRAGPRGAMGKGDGMEGFRMATTGAELG